MHRADAELALGRDFRLTAELAADGLTEWLERVVVRAGGDPCRLTTGRVCTCTPVTGGEWTLRGDGEDAAAGSSSIRGRRRPAR